MQEKGQLVTESLNWSTESRTFEINLDEPISLRELERKYIERVLALCDGNKTKAFKVLGIGRTTLYRKLGMRKD